MTARAVASLLAGIGLAGCSLLAPQPDRSRFFVLTPVAAEAGAAAPLAVALGLGPVTLPPYLAHGRLATRVAPNQIAYSERDWWAEPLAANVARALARDVALRLGSDDVVLHPWPSGTPLDYAVAVDVTRFEPDRAGTVRLVARVTIRDGRAADVLAVRDVALTQAAGGADAEAVVAAQSRALADLGGEITAAVRAVAARPRP
ncbi:MAG TPA: PqiC family protein [Candidatus Binatia bacterium]|nr:PqiC family protein [Candidatus Binatia bacterium]